MNTCTEHPRTRHDERCPCNPPEGERGTLPLYRVNAIRTHDGVFWLEVLSDGTWFRALSQTTVARDFVPGGKPYTPVPVV